MTKAIGIYSISETIKNVRFPLTVIVVMIHIFQNPNRFLIHGSPVFEAYPNCFFSFMYFFAEAFGRIAVPVFFAISGYLFFYKIEEFNKIVYLNKLKRRVQTLLIPYIIWNSLYIAFFYLKSTPLLSWLYPNATSDCFSDLNWWINAYWGYEGCPILYPLWYIRDLIMIIVLSPIVYYFLRHFGYLWIGMLFLLTTCLAGSEGGINLTAGLLYFSIGAFASIHKIENLRIIGYKGFLMIVFLLTAIIDTLTRGYDDVSPYFHTISIFIGFWWFISASALFNSIYKKELLEKCSFFIFLIHPFYITEVKIILIITCPINNLYVITLIHFICLAISLVIGVVLYKLLKLTIPRFLSLSTGSR